MQVKFIIPLDPVTKKNSGQITRSGKYPRLIPSKAYLQYEKDCGYFLKSKQAKISDPVEVTCKFYMKTRRKVDLTNLLNAIDDILVAYGVLADDNSNIIVSHDGSRVYYDKLNPRTEVDIHDKTEA